MSQPPAHPLFASGRRARRRQHGRPRRWLGAAVAALAAAASPAAAQPGFAYSTAEAERAMAEFSRCILASRARRALADRFLRMVPGTPGFGNAARQLAVGACVPRDRAGVPQMRFPPELLRAALFSARYRRDFAAAPPGDLAALPPLPISREFDAPPAAVPESVRILRAIGDCAARREPAAVHALLLTPVAGEEERQALDRAMPALQHCVPEGQELRFGRNMLRGILAEALDKLRRAAA